MLKLFNTNNEKSLMVFLLVLLSLFFNMESKGQSDKKFIRQGNKEYSKDKYSDSEISYRKAIDKNNESADAVFNSGDALYKQKKFEDAGKQFLQNYNMNEDNKKKSASLYNLGNSLLMSDKIKESIDAYKGSLKHDPQNMEAKYNLAVAQDLLKQQEEQQKQQQQQKDDKNNQDKDKDQDSQDKENDQNDEPQKQQPQDQQTISEEDAERILKALENDEKNVQEKVKLAKAAKERVRSVKNW